MDVPAVQLIHDDCLNCGKYAKYMALAFLDPPFNIGQGYPDYTDRIPDSGFRDMIQAAAKAAMECLKDDGLLVLHGPDHVVDSYLQLGYAEGWRRVAWINWFYAFGQCRTSNWVDARCHCLVYAKGDQYTWNPLPVMRPSARASRYADKRTLDSETPGMRLPGTVWGIPDDGPYWGRVQGNSRERIKSVPNQLPEVYIERLLKAYTNPGDSVLDMFGGSGTVPVVARALGRSCISMDVSSANVGIMQARLDRGAVRV